MVLVIGVLAIMAEEILSQIGHVLTSFHGAITQQNTLFSQQNTLLLNPSLSDTVPTFTGEQHKCRDWIESVIKYADVNNLDSAKRINAAYVTCRGLVSDFIRRWQEDNPAGTWDDLKTQLVLHFSEITDAEHAHALLRKIKQSQGEKVSHYAGRLHRLSRDAYPAADLAMVGAQ